MGLKHALFRLILLCASNFHYLLRPKAIKDTSTHLPPSVLCSNFLRSFRGGFNYAYASVHTQKEKKYQASPEKLLSCFKNLK